MKPFKQLISILALFCFFISSYAVANTSAPNNDDNFLIELQKEFADKTFAEIEQELRDELQELEMFTATPLSIDLQISSTDEPEYTEAITFPDKQAIQLAFNSRVDETKFWQRFVGDKSSIYLSISSRDLQNILNDYENYDFKLPTLATTKVFFKNGSSMDIANDLELINSNQRIVAIELTAKYDVPKKPITKLTFSNNAPQTQHNISLSSIQPNKASFTLPASSMDTILKVEGLDKQGKTLAFTGSNEYTFNEEEVKHVIRFYQELLKNIDNKQITTKDDLITYIYQNNSSLEQTGSDNSKTTMINYSYQGELDSVNIYLIPEVETFEYKTKLTTAKTKYINGLTVASDENNDKEGLINEQGQWIIQPTYYDITHQVDNYYLAYGRNDNDGTLYLVNEVQKTFKKQPFFIMDHDIYQGRFVITNKNRYNNSIKGLIDIKTYQTILPVEYNDISIEENFYITDKDSTYDSNPSIIIDIDEEDLTSKHFREVYNIKNHHKIYSGNAGIIIDKDNFITENKVCTNEKPAYYDYRSITQEGNELYCYSEYNLYDTKGQKMNANPYINIDGNFSQDNLLLVSDGKTQFFINRQAKTLNIDLNDYQKVNPFSQGLAAVICKNNERKGYIDIKGKLVIPCLYQTANYFQGGSAMVEYNKKYQLIRPDNSVIKVFDDRLHSYNNQQDAPKATYTFFDFKTYDHKGEFLIYGSN